MGSKIEAWYQVLKVGHDPLYFRTKNLAKWLARWHALSQWNKLEVIKVISGFYFCQQTVNNILPKTLAIFYQTVLRSSNHILDLQYFLRNHGERNLFRFKEEEIQAQRNARKGIESATREHSRSGRQVRKS